MVEASVAVIGVAASIVEGVSIAGSSVQLGSGLNQEDLSATGRNSIASSYIAGSVALESAVIHLEVAILNINSSTILGSVALEGAAMDLYNALQQGVIIRPGTAFGIYSSALKVACGPPGFFFFQDASADHHSSTYLESGVGVKGRIMDDKSSIINADCPSKLKVACPVFRAGN
jgi:hypothetical protein